MLVKNKPVLLFAFLIINISVYAQNFTKITEGDIVNDGGESFGAAWIDYNNDGFIDLFVSNGGAAALDRQSFLYRNNGDGTFTKIVTGNIVNDSLRSNGSSWGDIDNDGDLDAFIANRDGERNSFHLNNGNGSFTKIISGNFVTDGGNTNSCSMVDFNNDGKLDLFCANFMGQRFLYKNNSDNTFTRITTGLIVTDISNSISASWGDYDGDGWQDVYVCNAGINNNKSNLYKNNRDGTFTKITNSVVLNDGGASMGCDWGDYNNDGNPDLFVAHQANENDYLYKNNGDGTFTKITEGSIVSSGGQSISPSWVDIDNDGDLDLFVTNWTNQNDFLFINNGPPDYTFTKDTLSIITNDLKSTMGAAWGDYDNDGDMDLFVACRDNVNNLLYRNETSGNSWIKLNCTGNVSNRSAIGARIKIKSVINGIPTWQMREINAQSGYNSMNSLTVHFGLGNASKVDSLLIFWPSGIKEHYENILPNKLYLITETNGITGIEKNSSIPGSFKLNQNYPNPFNPATTIRYQIPSNSFVTINIYDVLGKEVSTLVNSEKQAGVYEVNFDASSLPSGIYFYRINAGLFKETKKMVLLR